MGKRRWILLGRSMVTGLVLVTVLATTFLPDWVTRTQAAPIPIETTETTDVIPEANRVDAGQPAPASPAASAEPVELTALNTLVFSEAGQADTLAAAIQAAGGYIYVREGDALFAGVDALSSDALTAAGARAVYRGTVPAADLAVLAPADRAAATAWNEVQAAPPVRSEAAPLSAGADTSLYFAPAPSRDGAASAALPTEEQTSVFLAGDVAVQVVFVESTGLGEDWTEAEVSKVKAEILNALDWWTTTSVAPDAPGAPPRPNANLTWDVSYLSPFDGDPYTEIPNIMIGQEPITQSVALAASGWILEIASRFTGMPASNAAVRRWAHTTRQNAGADWGFVLYVVDSSNDPDGRFDMDDKVGGAALNGPWAVVTYDAGDRGTDNLEALIAKMIGHVFGAGDESYNPDTPEAGCRNTERYGYFRIEHANCERAPESLAPSLMRSTTCIGEGAEQVCYDDMVDAYKTHMLSDSAREQVGWRDSDEDGVYDVMDTLSDTFSADYFGGSQPVCPQLHLADVDVLNTPAMPYMDDLGPWVDEGDIDDDGDVDQWAAYIWDPNTQTFNEELMFAPTNINRVGYVWGRINDGEWLEASPSDGLWNSEDEGYNILLPGEAGEINSINIAIMNRWEQESYLLDDPVNITIADPPATQATYESNSTTYVELFDASGAPGGWSIFGEAGDGYSGESTMGAGAAGMEACFAFNGSEVTLLHSTGDTFSGIASVHVDGELHSTISYDGPSAHQVEHVVTNLPTGVHTVQVIANGGGTMDFDAFEISDSSAGNVIDADPVTGDINPADDGFYEDTAPKVLYSGDWISVPLEDMDRPNAPPDPPGNTAHYTPNAYDRVYAHFTHADTVAIYRKVFPGGGSADVYLNGAYWGTMQNEATHEMITPFYISALSPDLTYYTIEVRVNPDTTGGFYFDALRLLNLADDARLYDVTPDDPDAPPPPPLEIDYTGPQEINGTWTPLRGGKARALYDGEMHTVYFKGSAIAVRRFIGRAGLLELYVDGKLVRTVDNWGRGAADVPVMINGLNPDRPHVLQVRIVSANPLRPRWNYIYGYTMYYVAPVTPGSYEEYNYDPDGTPTTSAFQYEGRWRAPRRYTREPGPSGDHYIFTSHADDRAYLYFTGADSATIYGVSSGGFGAADIYVNGELVGTFVQKGRTGYGHPFTITGMNPGANNVLELRVHIERGYRQTFSLDRVVLYNRPVLEAGTYENDGLVDIGGGEMVPALQFSGHWTTYANDEASGGAYALSGHIDDKLVFDVRNATSVTIYRRLYARYGTADVYVDGQYVTSFDNYERSRYGTYQAPFTIGGLDPGFNHQIEIRPQPFGRRLNRVRPFDIDYIVVHENEAAGTDYLYDAYYENDDSSAVAGNAITYVGSTWEHSATQSSAYIKGQRAVVLFKGNAFSFYLNYTSSGGWVRVYIDGQQMGQYRMRSWTTINHVPISFAGFDPDEIHTVELVALGGGYLNIDGYEAYDWEPQPSQTYDLVQGGVMTPNLPLIMSGNWEVSGESLRTREKNASLFIYAVNGDTLWTAIEYMRGHGEVWFYVNGERHSIADVLFVNRMVYPDTADFIVSGLKGMQTEGYWLEIRNPRGRWMMLQELRVGELGPTLTAGDDVEGEGPEVFANGYWITQPRWPDARYSGEYYLRGITGNSNFYIPVEGVSYVTVYRPMARGFGDAEVYVDGELWGTMPGYSARFQPSAPYSIGPLSSNRHVIELRAAHFRRDIVVDRITFEQLKPVEPGYYENDHVVFTGGYDADMDETYPGAYVGGWFVSDDANASGGTLHRTRVRGDRVEMVFYGTAITIYRRMWRGARFMKVYVDGQEYLINNRTRWINNQQAYTIPLHDEGPHSFEMVAWAGYLDFDAIEITSPVPATFGAYQHDSPYVVVNDQDHYWVVEDSPLHSEGAYIWTKTRYTNAFIQFYGQRVTTYFTLGHYWGRASIFLDGEFVEEIDMFNHWTRRDRRPDVLFTAYDLTNLPEGLHVLEVRFEGRVTRGGRRQINLDAFTIDGAPVPRPGEHVGPTEPDPGGGGDDPIDAPRDGCYEETHPEWLRVPDDGWFRLNASEASGDRYIQSPGVGQEIYMEFDFAAEGFGLVYVKDPSGTEVHVYVDGQLYTGPALPTGIINMFNETPVFLEEAMLNVTGFDPEVVHVVRFIHEGEANTYMYIDRLDLPGYDESYNDNCQYIPSDE